MDFGKLKKALDKHIEETVDKKADELVAHLKARVLRLAELDGMLSHMISSTDAVIFDEDLIDEDLIIESFESDEKSMLAEKDEIIAELERYAIFENSKITDPFMLGIYEEELNKWFS